MIVGYTRSTGLTNGGWDGYVLLLDSSNALLWSNHYGSTSEDMFNRVVYFSNGVFIIAGTYSDSTMKGWVYSIDTNQNQIFSKIISSKYESQLNAVAILNDGNIAVGGYGCNNGGIGYGYILKLDSSGTILWEKTYTSSSSTIHYFYSIVGGPDSNVFGCGIGKTNKFWVLMASSDGTQMWSIFYGIDTGNANCFSVALLFDEYYGAVGMHYVDTLLLHQHGQ